MNGPEHYRKAEKLLDQVGELYADQSELRTELLVEAQVHATLALAAAQVGTGPAAETWSEVFA